MGVQPTLLRELCHWWQLHHQLLARKPLLRMEFGGSQNDDGEARSFGESTCTQNQCEMRSSQFVTGRGSEVQVNEVPALGMIGLLTQISSPPARLGMRSGPHIAGVTPLRSSS